MLVVVLVLTVGLAISVPGFAHHGGASILSGKQVTMKGTVKAWLWANPHCLLTFDAKGHDGKVVQWVSETPAQRRTQTLSISRILRYQRGAIHCLIWDRRADTGTLARNLVIQ